MPPKRKSSGSAPAGGAKKSKAQISEIDSAVEAELKPVLDKRWSPVSVSRNADSSFRLRTRDRDHAFTYICLGYAPWRTEIGEEDDDSEDDEDVLEETLEKKRQDEAVSSSWAEDLAPWAQIYSISRCLGATVS